MSEVKTLKIKRVFAYAIYNNLKNIAPKDYPTTGEIKSTIGAILPGVKQHISKYLDIVKFAEELSESVVSKKVSEEEAKIKVDELNAEWAKYNKDGGNEIVEVSLNDEDFKILKSQFERENWGKNWVKNIEEFGELMESFI